MIFTTIHNISRTKLVDVYDEEGVLVGQQEKEITVKKNLKTPIYLELDDIRMIMPYFSNAGRLYKNRTLVKTRDESYVLYHTFKYLSDLKNAKHKEIEGFT
jgi:hypothetical protein